ncbi:unnamed protein product, partial [Polarella glacialis]
MALGTGAGGSLESKQQPLQQQQQEEQQQQQRQQQQRQQQHSLEPQTWEQLSASWLGAILSRSVGSFEYDLAFVVRGEGDRVRRLLLHGCCNEEDSNSCPSSVFVKSLEPHEAAFYLCVAPLLTRIRVRIPCVLWRGKTLLLLEDLGAPPWVDVQLPERSLTLPGTLEQACRLYARLHAATWRSLPPANTCEHTAVCLARSVPVLSSWRAACDEPGVRAALKAATAENGCLRLQSLSAKLCLAVFPHWASCEARLHPVACVIHGDPHGRNVLDLGQAGALSPDSLCLVDFESAAFDHPVWDLALLLFQLWPSQWSEAPRQVLTALAEAYSAELLKSGVRDYDVGACLSDLEVAVTLCFVGFAVVQAAESSREWWRGTVAEEGFESASFALERVLSGPSADT